jgi:hypothetical protein
MKRLFMNINRREIIKNINKRRRNKNIYIKSIFNIPYLLSNVGKALYEK